MTKLGSAELRLHVCGGRGKQSRKTPAELTVVANMAGVAGDALVRVSRLAAKIDNNWFSSTISPKFKPIPTSDFFQGIYRGS
jgi:hypothetical protein